MTKTELAPPALLPGVTGPVAVTTSRLIGPKQHTLRHAVILTLAQVAEKVGIAQGVQSEIERNKASPSVATLIRLCDTPGKSVGSLSPAADPGWSAPVRVAGSRAGVILGNGVADATGKEGHVAIRPDSVREVLARQVVVAVPVAAVVT